MLWREGVVTVGWTPVARVNAVAHDQPATVAWNMDAVHTMELDKDIILEKFNEEAPMLGEARWTS